MLQQLELIFAFYFFESQKYGPAAGSPK